MDSCSKGIQMLSSLEQDKKPIPHLPLEMKNKLLEETFPPIRYTRKQFHYGRPLALDEMGVL
jgi:hypothetical protein